MSNPRRPLPPWLLERVLLGELPDPLPEATRRRLEAGLPAEEDEARLVQENEAFLKAHPPETFVRAVRRRTASERSPRMVPVLGFALAAAVALVVVVVRPTLGDGETERIKGLQPALSIYRKTPGGAEPLGRGAHVRPGDVLQLKYRPAGKRYGVIVSVDGVRQITLHLPEATTGGAAFLPPAETLLPRAYQLDAAPHFERFLFVTSDRPLDAREVMAATRTWAERGFPAPGPALGEAAQVIEVTLVKDFP